MLPRHCGPDLTLSPSGSQTTPAPAQPVGLESKLRAQPQKPCRKVLAHWGLLMMEWLGSAPRPVGLLWGGIVSPEPAPWTGEGPLLATPWSQPVLAAGSSAEVTLCLLH